MNWERFYQNYRKPDYLKGYEIVNKLGAGVFGEVYKIRKVSIGKFYAVKFLRVEDPSLKNAVVRELESVKLLAQIDHPNLVSIEDQGEIDAIPYIIMSYAGEQTLKHILEQGSLPEHQAIDFFRQVCSGVQALHDRSIIHFDLKPANIYLKGELARVGDYGLSKLVSRTRRSLSFGRGTPYYMAPEMLHRRGDHRSDIYSLGVILFECLSGDVPFKGDTEWEVLKKHETQEVTFPPNLPLQFRPAIQRAMAKNPHDRFSSVSELKLAVDPGWPDGSSYSDRLASVVQTNSTSGSPDTATPDTRPLLAGPNTQGLGLFLLLAPVRLIYHLINKSARILTRMVINLARIPLRMIEWGIHIVIFVVMVIIFFTILHLLFKIPFVLLGIS